ncbi:MAG: response regulator transcription factor [Chitinophagaceae bacterium]|nr:MAG: response regulator transcription factor [Chitinophagaceae bacterium]
MKDLQKDISVLTADDHTIVRTGLHMVLQLRFGITRYYEADSCAELLASVRRNKPTHLIVDSIFKDGNSLELMPVLVNLFPGLKVMVYSMLPADVYEAAFRKHGVAFYLHKSSSQEKIESTLRAFLFNDGADAPRAREAASNPFAQLSTRELEVLHYLLRGEAIGETASALNLHKNTVSTLKSRIFEKVGAANLKELIDKASAHQINP